MLNCGSATISIPSIFLNSSAANAARSSFSFELFAEWLDAEELERQPDAQTAKVARQLGRELAEIDQLVRLLHGRQIVGVAAVRGAQQPGVADDQRAGAERQEERLVRIEHHRVGLIHTAQSRTASLCQGKKGAVRAIDVEPHLLRARHARQRGEIVDRAGVRRPRAPRQHERAQPGGTVARDGLLQPVEAHAELRVALDLADVRGGKAARLADF